MRTTRREEARWQYHREVSLRVRLLGDTRLGGSGERWPVGAADTVRPPSGVGAPSSSPSGQPLRPPNQHAEAPQGLGRGCAWGQGHSRAIAQARPRGSRRLPSRGTGGPVKGQTCPQGDEAEAGAGLRPGKALSSAHARRQGPLPPSSPCVCKLPGVGFPPLGAAASKTPLGGRGPQRGSSPWGTEGQARSRRGVRWAADTQRVSGVARAAPGQDWGPFLGLRGQGGRGGRPRERHRRCAGTPGVAVGHDGPPLCPQFLYLPSPGWAGSRPTSSACPGG